MDARMELFRMLLIGIAGAVVAYAVGIAITRFLILNLIETPSLGE